MMSQNNDTSWIASRLRDGEDVGVMAVDVQADAVAGLALGGPALSVVRLVGTDINSLDDTWSIGAIGSVGILDSAKDHLLVSNVHCMNRAYQ